MTPPISPLEKTIGVSFINPDLLRLALVHSSYVNENSGESITSNERLEFLGDALIGLVTACELYERNEELCEGELTTLRSVLVRGETLAVVANSLGLGEHLVVGKGEGATGGRLRPSNLAAAFESLVGAVFLDQGYAVARSFVLKSMAKELSAVSRREIPQNHKSLLQELVQSKGDMPPIYRVLKESSMDHDRCFTTEVLVSNIVVARGRGHRKSQAEQEAARKALKILRRKS